jgi:hypothetical protein
MIVSPPIKTTATADATTSHAHALCIGVSDHCNDKRVHQLVSTQRMMQLIKNVPGQEADDLPDDVLPFVRVRSRVPFACLFAAVYVAFTRALWAGQVPGTSGGLFQHWWLYVALVGAVSSVLAAVVGVAFGTLQIVGLVREERLLLTTKRFLGAGDLDIVCPFEKPFLLTVVAFLLSMLVGLVITFVDKLAEHHFGHTGLFMTAYTAVRDALLVLVGHGGAGSVIYSVLHARDEFVQTWRVSVGEYRRRMLKWR